MTQNTKDTTEQNLSFAESEADFKPTLVCVGEVGEIEDAYLSESENYIVVPIGLDALDAGRNTKVYFLYRPEWLTGGFKPHSLKKQNKGAHFVYSKNIASKDSLSVLRGIAGNKDAFGRLSNALLSLPIQEGTTGPSMEDVTATIREFVADNVDSDGQKMLVGYELRQQVTPTGETYTDEKDGKVKKVYQKENRYNVHGFWDVTTDNIKRQKSRAEKSGVDEDSGKKKTIFAYASGVPF